MRRGALALRSIDAQELRCALTLLRFELRACARVGSSCERVSVHRSSSHPKHPSTLRALRALQGACKELSAQGAALRPCALRA